MLRSRNLKSTNIFWGRHGNPRGPSCNRATVRTEHIYYSRVYPYPSTVVSLRSRCQTAIEPYRFEKTNEIGPGLARKKKKARAFSYFVFTGVYTQHARAIATARRQPLAHLIGARF